jgi:hypothetical protein
MRHFVLLPILFLTVASASAQPVPAAGTRYTELVGGRCRFISEDKQTGEDAVKRCPGHDLEVETFASHTRTTLSVRFSRTQRAEDVVKGWSLGRTIEWRGPKGKKGFEPYAAVVRVLMKDPEGASPRPDGDVLAVMRVDTREAQACVVAYVDARANPGANKLARDTADRLAPTHLCGSDKPVVAGIRTRWTDELTTPR